jgi:hypothetical protein
MDLLGGQCPTGWAGPLLLEIVMIGDHLAVRMGLIFSIITCILVLRTAPLLSCSFPLTVNLARGAP